MSGSAERVFRERGERSSGPQVRATRCGQLLGQTYQLMDVVGAGGMAEVYAAEHLRLGRRFAVKLPRSNLSPKALERFQREVRAMALIDSDFVVRVSDCGEAEDGTPYLVMDLLKGEDLRALLERDGPLPIRRAASLIWEACQGVAAVHQAGLVHRDIKPENLFIAKRSTGEDWCKVLDFGIAKTDFSGSTVEGIVIGTVRYMAPEQLENAATADVRADIYALGAVLYESLCGDPPHAAASVQELMFKIMNESAVRLDAKSSVPAALADVVERALSRLPENRFKDVQEFAAALAPYVQGVTSTSNQLATVTGTEPLAAPRSRPATWRSASVTLVMTLVATTLGFVAGSFTFPGSGQRARDRSVVSVAPARPSAAQPRSFVAVSATAPLPSPPAGAVMSAPVARAIQPVHVRPAPAPLLPRTRFDSANPYDR